MMHEKFLTGESLDAAMHEKVMDLFKKYLLIGGLPDAVNSFIADTNIVKVRTIHRDIRAFYADDASKYEADNSREAEDPQDLRYDPLQSGEQEETSGLSGHRGQARQAFFRLSG